MKESLYNHFIDNGDTVVCFNAYKNSYMLISKVLYTEFEIYKKNVEKLISIDKNFYNALIDNGFIIEEDVNERDCFISSTVWKKKERKEKEKSSPFD